MGLRPMGAGDIGAVCVLEEMTNPHPWPRCMFVEELKLGPSRCGWLVSEAETDEGKLVVGFGGVAYTADTGHIMGLAVHSRWRRQGIGRQLWHGLAQCARHAGASELTLEVRVSNVEAIALYLSLGMVRAGVVPGYYSDGEDALLFELAGLQ